MRQWVFAQPRTGTSVGDGWLATGLRLALR